MVPTDTNGRVQLLEAIGATKSPKTKTPANSTPDGENDATSPISSSSKQPSQSSAPPPPKILPVHLDNYQIDVTAPLHGQPIVVPQDDEEKREEEKDEDDAGVDNWDDDDDGEIRDDNNGKGADPSSANYIKNAIRKVRLAITLHSTDCVLDVLLLDSGSCSCRPFLSSTSRCVAASDWRPSSGRPD